MQSLVCFLAWNRKGVEVKWKEERERRKKKKSDGISLMCRRDAASQVEALSWLGDDKFAAQLCLLLVLLQLP